MTSLPLLLSAVCAAFAATGLSTRMADVRVEGLEPGHTYELQARGVHYTVFNRGDGPVDVAIEPLAPKSDTLLAGYEPVPDTGWVGVSPSSQPAAPGAAIETALTVAIPPRPELAGRRFQANLWSRTVGGGLGVGVLSRLRLELAPGEVRVDSVTLSAGGSGLVRLSNDSRRKRAFELRIASAAAPGGWSAGEPADVVLEQEKIKVKAGRAASVGARLPGKRAYLIVVEENGKPVASGWIYDGREN
jgi:hypothetical protein